MGVSTSRKTVKPRRTPKQAAIKKAADLINKFARMFADQDPRLAKHFAAIAKRGEKLSTPTARKR